MPPSRLGPTGHRRRRLKNMTRRGKEENIRSPSPDIEEDEEMRKEHFSYYNLPYCSRKLNPNGNDKVIFKNPFKEDQRYTEPPFRRRPASSQSPAAGLQESLPIRGPPKSRRVSAVNPLHLDTNVQLSSADPFKKHGK